jgi:hypothetical protein
MFSSYLGHFCFIWDVQDTVRKPLIVVIYSSLLRPCSALHPPRHPQQKFVLLISCSFLDDFTQSWMRWNPLMHLFVPAPRVPHHDLHILQPTPSWQFSTQFHRFFDSFSSLKFSCSVHLHIFLPFAFIRLLSSPFRSC